MTRQSKEGSRRLTLNPKVCIGCRSCEMACSFHHSRSFAPAAASIKVMKIDGNRIPKHTMLNSCDLCPDEETPYCVRYCPSGCLGVTAV